MEKKQTALKAPQKQWQPLRWNGDSVALSPTEQQRIQEWISAHGTPQQVALRCRIIAGAAEGEADSAIARRLSVNRTQ